MPSNSTEFALFPGDGYRFLRGDELPTKDDEFIRHNMRDEGIWTKCGTDFNFLTAAKLEAIGFFVRRRK